jgi:hypothetical protein
MDHLALLAMSDTSTGMSGGSIGIVIIVALVLVFAGGGSGKGK